MNNMVQVYSESKHSPRLAYAVDLVLGTILRLKYVITDNPDHDKPLINYSNDRSVGGIFIEPENLLFEKGIRKQDIWIAHMENLPLFFQQPPEAGFPLDIFAFSFYMVTRYEEYLPFQADEHGRFAAESSLAYKHSFLDLPLVDIWAIRLGQTLSILYPSLIIPVREYSSLLSIDVDQPFAYRSKGLLRNLGGLVIDILKKRSPYLRVKCISGRQADPYDTYDYINEIAEKSDCPVAYFFSAGKRSRFDLNPNPATNCYSRLIKRLSEKFVTGLHPSYLSGSNIDLAEREKKILEAVAGKKIEKSRQHYLLLRFPVTYQRLLKLDIKSDYSFGFIREPGFRGGIARPFFFYDIEREEKTGLMLVPFQYMDGTLQQYKRYSAKEAIDCIERLVSRTREVGGMFVSVWHNTSLTEKDGWEGWRSIFEKALFAQKV